MYKYAFTLSNPEGFQAILDYEYEIKMTADEFEKICNEEIVYAYESEYKQSGVVFRSSISTEHIHDYMISKGFVPPEPSVHCDFDPWARECIKDEKILQWIDRKEPEDQPPYLKGMQ